MAKAATLQQLSPREAAEQLFAAHQGERAWLDAFAEYLDRRRGAQSLARIIEVWDLSQADVARIFGVSRQAVGKWLQQGAPAERAAAVGDVAAATDLLVRYLKRDRIAAVVRRPIPAIGGSSLLEVLVRGDTPALLTACRDMFDFEHAQG